MTARRQYYADSRPPWGGRAGYDSLIARLKREHLKAVRRLDIHLSKDEPARACRAINGGRAIDYGRDRNRTAGPCLTRFFIARHGPVPDDNAARWKGGRTGASRYCNRRATAPKLGGAVGRQGRKGPRGTREEIFS